MTEQIREKVSTLMDGELEYGACPDRLNEQHLVQTWRRYHIISDIMHQRLPVNTDSLLANNISEAIKNEPTILAPVPRTAPTYMKPLAGLAVAASVAAMAIIGVQQYRGDGLNNGQQQPIQLELARSEPQAPTLQYGVPVQVRPVSAESSPGQTAQMQYDPRISRYILNHNEYQSNMGVQGMTPHVRLVVTGADE